MKLRLTLVSLAVAALSTELTMAGSDVFTAYTGKAVFLAFLDPGTVQCPGGEPTGQWPAGPPCSPGSRVNLRGVTFLYRDETTDPRTTGNAVVVSNLNTEGWTPWGPGSGEMWGTISLEVAPGELWEGTFAGKREITADGPYSSMRAELHGTGGTIQGLKAQYQVVFSPPGTPMADGIITGRIVEPGAR